MNSLSEEQRFALRSDGGVVLTAGPGSGKTTTLVEKYLQLLSKGASPDSVLVVTFTRAAAAELRARALRKLEENGASAALRSAVRSTQNVGTIHGWCLEIARLAAPELNLPPPTAVATGLEEASASAEASEEAWRELATDARDAIAGAWTPGELQHLLGVARESRSSWESGFLRAPSTNAAVAGLQVLAKAFFVALDKRFVRKGVYSFSDLERVALHAVRTLPALRRELGERIEYLLVDEFQDTSRAQWEILQAVLPAPDTANCFAKVFAVGDPRQSIYRFRHADPALFAHLGESVERGGGARTWLRANFRSVPPLVKSLNALTAQLFASEGDLATEMVAGQDGDATAPALSVVRYPSGKTRDLSRASEVEAVAEAIAQAGTPYDEVAVLFRSAEPMTGLATALGRRGIPVAGRRSVPLFSMSEAEDLRWFLRALLAPNDDFALAAVLRSAFVRSDEKPLMNASEARAEQTLAEVWTTDRTVALLRDLATAPTALEAIGRWIADAPFPLPMSPAVAAFLDGIPADASLAAASEAVERWREDEVRIEVPFGDRGVQLATIHSAKGLEYCDVYLVDLLRTPPQSTPPVRVGVDGRVGFRVRTEDGAVGDDTWESLAEEEKEQSRKESNRLLFVAATRAKTGLVVALPEQPYKSAESAWAGVMELVCSL